MERIQFLESILGQLPAQVSILQGAQHTFTLVNPPAQEVLGDRNVIGKTVREALPELEGQGFFELLDQVFTTGERFEQKAVPATILRDGKLVDLYVDITYLPLTDDGNQIVGVISFTYDVTAAVLAKKAAEEAAERLALAYEDLEVKVRFRNLELEKKNRELSEANAELQRKLDELLAQ